MIDACRRASAKNITAVIPYFGYARADRKASVLYVTLLHGIHDSLSRWFITFYV
jgi:ribose-phosphate pyrophosphokinase